MGDNYRYRDMYISIYMCISVFLLCFVYITQKLNQRDTDKPIK